MVLIGPRPVTQAEFPIFPFLSNGATTPRTLADRFDDVVNPDDFGCPLNDATDAAPALQAAIDYAAPLGLPVRFPANRGLRLNSALLLKVGKADANDPLRRYDIDLNGCALQPTGAFPAFNVRAECPVADIGTGREVAYFSIRNGIIYGALAAAGSTAITIGTAGKAISGWAHSRIENILITSFASNTSPLIAIQGDHTRMLVFRDLIQRGTRGLSIACSVANGFVGDLTFTECEFAGTLAAPPIILTSSATVTASQVRGIRFLHCVVYGSGTQLTSSNLSKIGDIWFQNCQFDGPGSVDYAITVTANGTSVIFKLFFTNCYVVNYEAGILLQSEATAELNAVRISGGGFSQINGTGNTAGGAAEYTIYGFQIKNLIVQGVSFDTIARSICMNFDSSGQWMVQGCFLGADNVDYFVQTLNACNNYVVTDNLVNTNTALVLDSAGGANKLIATTQNLTY